MTHHQLRVCVPPITLPIIEQQLLTSVDRPRRHDNQVWDGFIYIPNDLSSDICACMLNSGRRPLVIDETCLISLLQRVDTQWRRSRGVPRKIIVWEEKT